MAESTDASWLSQFVFSYARRQPAGISMVISSASYLVHGIVEDRRHSANSDIAKCRGDRLALPSETMSRSPITHFTCPGRHTSCATHPLPKEDHARTALGRQGALTIISAGTTHQVLDRDARQLRLNIRERLVRIKVRDRLWVREHHARSAERGGHAEDGAVLVRPHLVQVGGVGRVSNDIGRAEEPAGPCGAGEGRCGPARGVGSRELVEHVGGEENEANGPAGDGLEVGRDDHGKRSGRIRNEGEVGKEKGPRWGACGCSTFVVNGTAMFPGGAGSVPQLDPGRGPP